MALPRRVPWASQEEYEEVFGLLFASNGDLNAQRRAVDRIHVWQSRGCCPYAAEATASILAVIMRDASAGRASTSAFPEELRLAYSMSLTRFVNGLVDPAQQGPFARSIASIAAQIGLPLWFVELRHAATHEDLPSLHVLRDAARKAMDWLYQRYWLAQMQAQTSDNDEIGSDALSEAQKAEITRLLTLYKRLQKEALRDATLSKGRDLAKVTHAIGRWAVDIGTSRASLSISAGTQAGIASDDTTFGCQALAQVMTEAGFLVPTSKKKRASSKDTEIPKELYAIWTPLLQHLDEVFEDFSTTLIWQCMDLLSGTNDDDKISSMNGVAKEKSYINTIKIWATVLLPNEDDDMQEDILRFCLLHSNVYTAYILSSILASREHLAEPVKALQRIQRSEPALVAPVADADVEAALSRFAQRLEQVAAQQISRATDSVPPVEHVDQTSGSRWRLVPEASWQPCPFGMLPGGIQPSLEVV